MNNEPICLFPPPATASSSNLITSKPSASHDGRHADVGQELEQKYWKVWDLVMKTIEADRGRYLELKTWLMSSLSDMQVGASTRSSALEPYLFQSRSSSTQPVEVKAVQEQLLLLWIEQQPSQAAGVLIRDPGVFRDFFEGSSKRILLWFSHFSMDGLTAFKFGARALALYALAHRDEVWQHLVWEGKHSQAPVTVATKTHYFCELDVVSSVRNLITHCPGFWESEIFRDNVTAGGDVLLLQPNYFCKALQDMLLDGGRPAEVLQSSLKDWLATGSWTTLCHRVLHCMTDEQLLQFTESVSFGVQDSLKAVLPHQQQGQDSRAYIARGSTNSTTSEAVFQRLTDLRCLMLSEGVRWRSVPQLVLTHAMATCSRQLLQLLLEDDELQDTMHELLRLTSQCHPPSADLHTQTQQAQTALVSSLRNPAGSVSSRQLVALHAWTLFMALCRHGMQHSSIDISNSQLFLTQTFQHLGGTCSFPGSDVGPSSASKLAHMSSDSKLEGSRKPDTSSHYDLLSSSSSDESPSGIESETDTETGDHQSSAKRRKVHEGKTKRKKHKKSKKSRSKRQHKHRRSSLSGLDDSDDRVVAGSADDGLDTDRQSQGTGTVEGLTTAQLKHLASLQLRLTLPWRLIERVCSDSSRHPTFSNQGLGKDRGQDDNMWGLECSVVDAVTALTSISFRDWWSLSSGC